MAAAEAEQQGVRFASQDDEISPMQSTDEAKSGQGLHTVETITGLGESRREDLNPEAIEELQQLRTTLQNNMQSARMQHHTFEPISLPSSQPASRVRTLSSTNVTGYRSMTDSIVRSLPAHRPPTEGSTSRLVPQHPRPNRLRRCLRCIHRP
jgi:hypothetical protein